MAYQQTLKDTAGNKVAVVTIKGGRPPQFPPCHTCRFCVGAHADAEREKRPRCHWGPPWPRFPYADVSSWVPVPAKGGGCGRHEEARS